MPRIRNKLQLKKQVNDLKNDKIKFMSVFKNVQKYFADAKTRITNTSDKAWSELSLSQKLDAFNLEKQGFNKRYYDELADLEARVNSGARSGVEAEQLGTGTMAQAILRLQTHKKEGLNDLNKNFN